VWGYLITALYPKIRERLIERWIERHGPPPFLLFVAELGRWMASPSWPCSSVTMPHVRQAISFARRPAFTDSRSGYSISLRRHQRSAWRAVRVKFEEVLGLDSPSGAAIGPDLVETITEALDRLAGQR
jgi:hypothetical protein